MDNIAIHRLKGSTAGDDGDWSLLLGQQVRIRKDGLLVRTGEVEAVAESADALWIAAHGVESRVLYEKSRGYSVELIAIQTHSGT